MKYRAFYFCHRRLLLSLLMLSCLVYHGTTLTANADETSDKLKTVVHLAQGVTTLAQLATSVSQQTGLKIEPVEYLREHRLVVSMDNLSAGSALDTLAEMNDWVLEENTPSHILITRPKAKSAETFAEVAAALKAALPKDFRRFTGVEGVSRYTEAMIIASRANDTDAHKTEARKLFSNATSFDQAEQLMQRNALVYPALLPDILDNKRHDTMSLSSEQQRPLLALFVLESFATANHSQAFMQGEVLPFESSPENCMASVNDGSLVIGSAEHSGTQHRFYFFAAPLDLHYEPAPKR